MRLTGRVCGWLGVAIAVSGTALAQQSATKHPFAAKDWAALRSAGAAAVSPDGTILYQVNFGGDSGPTHKEWWTIAADGSHAVKLVLPEEFSPKGFTHDGHGLYGAWKVNKLEQLAIFSLEDGKAAAVPSTVVLLPRGIQTAKPSPDGKRFAIISDPRLPDQLEEVRHVYEPDQTSLYVVNADGTGGQWWCSDLKSISEMAWSADANSIALLSASPRIGHHDVTTSIDVCNATDNRHLTDIPNAAGSIGWTNDGHEIAFLSTKSAVLTPEHVWTVPAAGGVPEDRTPNFDGTALQLDSDVRGRLWVFVDRGVRSEVDDFQSGTLKPVYRWPDGVLSGVPIGAEYASASEQVTLTVGDPSHSRNLAVPEGDHLRKITHEGDEQLSATDLGSVKVVQWKSKDDISLEGIETFPAGFVAGQKYPFLVLPHGGPEANDELTLDPLARIIAGLEHF
jgi:dipeptidyl aminopeptidase/acylaminoacyl peptidase